MTKPRKIRTWREYFEQGDFSGELQRTAEKYGEKLDRMFHANSLMGLIPLVGTPLSYLASLWLRRYEFRVNTRMTNLMRVQLFFREWERRNEREGLVRLPGGAWVRPGFEHCIADTLPRQPAAAVDHAHARGSAQRGKSSSKVQTWKQNRYSALQFGIAPSVKWDPETGKYSNEVSRADIYVFCVLSQTKVGDHAAALDMDNWKFRVARSSELPDQRTVAWDRLADAAGAPCGFIASGERSKMRRLASVSNCESMRQRRSPGDGWSAYVKARYGCSNRPPPVGFSAGDEARVGINPILVACEAPQDLVLRKPAARILEDGGETVEQALN